MLKRSFFIALAWLAIPLIVEAQTAATMLSNGDSLYKLKQFDDAIFAYSRSAEISLSKHEADSAAVAYDRISGLYLQMRNYDKSIVFGEKALALHTGTNDRDAMARTSSSIGTVYYYKGEYDLALDNYGRSLALRRELNDSTGIADMLLNLGSVHNVMANYLLAMERYEEAYILRKALGDMKGLASVLNNIGTILREQGRYTQSVNRYTEALRIREEMHDTLGIISSLVNMGIIYQAEKYLDEALDYYMRALKLVELVHEERYMAIVVNNIGGIYQLKGEMEEALRWLNRSSDVMQRTGNRSGYASTLGNIGEVLIKLGQIEQAKVNYDKSLLIRKELGDRKGIASALIGLATIEKVSGRSEQALMFADSALTEAKAIHAMTVIEEASGMLYALYRLKGYYQMALPMYELNIAMKDSLRNEEHQRTLMRLQFQSDYEKKEAILSIEQGRKDDLAAEQLRSKLLQRNVGFAGLALMMAIAALFFAQRNRIFKEKQRSESLLLNILPEATALELKEKGEVTPKLHVNTTVIFTDFVGFTELADRLPAKELVVMLDSYFKAYDRIIRKHRLEKIKTIGDAYMAASGLKNNGPDATVRAVEAALEMVMETERLTKETGIELKVRVGVHTGPVVAGVVGDHKFQYDIWGDTVNIASRMETSGQAGKVNISHATYEQVNDSFSCIYRGEIPVKGKGVMRMYFAEALA
jgi:class 3 adenylate cyclase/Tfp pilus assembly protein PilF